MLINEEDDINFVTIYAKKLCPFHKRTPWVVDYAGCTCSTSIAQIRATPEEKQANIKRKKEESERRKQYIKDYEAGLIG